MNMRTKTEIIKDFHQAQTVYDRLIMEIGLHHARIQQTNESNLISTVNQKIEALQRTETQIRILEQELANAKD